MRLSSVGRFRAAPQLHRFRSRTRAHMNDYRGDWVGALLAGAVSAIVLLLIRRLFPKLAGVSFYIVLGLLIAVISLGARELLRHVGI